MVFNLHLIILFACTVLFNSIAGSLYAQETLTLNEVLSAAKENNQGMKKARKTIETAKAQLVTAASYPNPEINFQTYNFGSILSNDEFGIGQEIDLFGKTGIRELIAESNISIANYELNLLWSEAAFEIKGLYYDLLLMEKKKALANENVSIFHKFVDSARLKYNSGSILLNEVVRAKVELSQAENELLFNEKELKMLRARFNLVIGKPINYEFSPGESPVFEQENIDCKMLTQKAIANNPELKIRDMLTRRNKTEIELRKKEIFPNPKIGLLGRMEEGVFTLGAGISIGLPVWNQNDGAIKEARSEAEKNTIDIEFVNRNVETAVYEACLEVEYASKQIAILKKSLEQFVDIQNQVDLQYKEGKVDFLTCLDSLRAVRNIKVGYFEAVGNYNKKIALIKKLTDAGLE